MFLQLRLRWCQGEEWFISLSSIRCFWSDVWVWGWFWLVFCFFLSFCSNNISGYLALVHDIIMIWFLQYSCLVSCFMLHVWTAVSFLKYRALLLLLLNFVLMTSGRFGSLLSLEDRIRLCNRVLAKSSSSALFKNCINTLFHHQR